MTSPFADPGHSRLFWRIVFKVINGETRLTREVTLWEWLEISKWRRIGRWDVPLRHELVGVENIDYQINSDSVTLMGGYIQFHDGPPHAGIDYLESLGEDWPGRSSVFHGQNVAVSAEVKLDTPKSPPGPEHHGPPFGEPEEPVTLFPILYYPQSMSEPHEGLAFYGRRQGAGYDLALRIRGEELAGSSIDYLLSGNNHYHRVRATQYQLSAGSDRPHQFQFLADVISLGSAPTSAPGGLFEFGPKEKTCYIGRMPKPTLHPRLEIETWFNLYGEVRWLVFDPNDSCPTCGPR